MNRLAPPRQPVPNNLGLFLLNAGLVFSFILLNWMTGLNHYLSGMPANPVETTVLARAHAVTTPMLVESHPMYTVVEGWGRNMSLPALQLNRILSGAGFFFGLVVLLRMMVRQTSWLLATPGIFLWLSFPGMSLLQIGAGGTGIPVWLFLMSVSAMSEEGDGLTRIHAGMCAGLACCLDPIWMLPVLGLLIGVLETNRLRLRIFLPALLVALVAGCTCTFFLDADWFGRMVPSRLPPEIQPDWGHWLLAQTHRHGIVVAITILVLVHGFTRRGIGWWLLLMSLPAALLAPLFHPDPLNGLVPLVLVFCLVLPRAPALLGIRYPTLYQSVFAIQMLFWLPGYLHPVAEPNFEDWMTLETRIREAPGPVFSQADVAVRLAGDMPVTLLSPSRRHGAQMQETLSTIREKTFAYVILDTEAPALPEDLQAELDQCYKPQQTLPPFRIWVPRHVPVPSLR